MTKPRTIVQEREIFKTADDFERRFFPNAYLRRKLKEKSREPRVYGTDLAIDLLREIRQGMANPSSS